MNYPILNEIPRHTSTTERWLGYRHTRRIADGESYDEWNLSAEEYPMLAPRKPRAVFRCGINPQGLIAKDALCWIDGSSFVMNGYAYEMGLSTAAEDCPKKLVSMGAYVIILPDKKYINTSDTEDRGNIEAAVEVDNVRFTLCRDDGQGYDGSIESVSAPENPADGQYWVDLSSSPNALKQWSSSQAMWVTLGSSYVKMAAAGIGAAFREGDGIELTGAEENEALAPLMGSTVIWARDDDYIVIPGMLGQEQTAESIRAERRMPEMDFVIESGNRLWGCRYGPARNGQIVNEIYASKLGDFKNWNVFQGISTDSWVGSCGSDGQWTGAINYLGYPLFFKTDHIHRVYGSLPSQYSIQDTAARGVEKGSEKSLAMVNEVLLYKSRTGIMAFDGSLPADISEALGNVHYSMAVAGSHGSRYWVSMVDDDGSASLFCYDLKLGLWHKEDDLRATEFCSARNHMYCIAGDRILSLTGDGEAEAEPVTWMAITGEIGLTQVTSYGVAPMPEEMYLSKLHLRLALEPGSVMTVSVAYDGESKFHKTAILRGSSLRSFTLPIRPRRCDWLRLKLECVGPGRVYSLTRYIENGSDVNSSDGQMLDF